MRPERTRLTLLVLLIVAKVTSYQQQLWKWNSLFFLLIIWIPQLLFSQEQSTSSNWIRPGHKRDVATWGIRNGIVFSLWPYGLETEKGIYGGGPRGLIRVGVEREGKTYLLNFLAIEPVVRGKMEFSEISPSVIDGKWGKLMWSNDTEEPSAFFPTANSEGVITHPDPQDPSIEELSIYVFMEQYNSGAHPYLKLSIRSDHPHEICIQIFNREDSKKMDYCNITATMGNYARLRQLYLKDRIIDARVLYKDYKGINFIEKEAYPAEQLIQSGEGYYFAFATGNERLEELQKWPGGALAKKKENWRYRPPIKFTQYWRTDKISAPGDLRVRVNGRYKYWSGGSREPEQYMEIPGGAAFENFELRATYTPGQKLIFGITTQTPAEILSEFKGG